MLRLGATAGGIAANAAREGVRRWWSGDLPGFSAAVLSAANAQQLAAQLSRMRGAAMKMGQIMSLEGDALLPPAVTEALAMLRASGDTMSKAQLYGVLTRAYGKRWRERFAEFEEDPVASASIGQVHRARRHDGTTLALKIQFPGVAKSIESDVDNLATLLRLIRVFPADTDLKPFLQTIKRELRRETDYKREGENMERFAALLEGDARYLVPRVHSDLTTARILAMDYVDARPLSELWSNDFSQSLRDHFGRNMQALVLSELFEYGWMQSDPNSANFMTEPDSGRLVLLDFGSTIRIPRELSERYLRIVRASIADDRDLVARLAREFGWLEPGDSEDQARGLADFIVLSIEPLVERGVYDYGASDLPSRARSAGMKLAFERELRRPPPSELLFVQRKLGGTFLLCQNLRAQLNTRALVEPYL